MTLQASRRLSGRDVELLGHLAAGRSTRQVALAMSISTNTVRTRVRRVQGKLDVSGRDEVLRRGRELGIL
jgi:DNA-binding CsgD family transcriptional regulator